MKKIILKTIFFLFILTSCNYKKEQNEILNKIRKSKSEVFSENYRNKIIKSFKKNEIIELSFNTNTETSLYFYQILVEKFPQDAFNVFLKNIDNINIITIATSYDTLEEMTVASAMLYYATLRNNIFSEKQLNEILDKVIFDLKNKRHLTSYLSMYLYKNKSKPNPKYYNILKNEILETSLKSYFEKTGLINYFSNYNKPDDVIILKDYIEKIIYEESTYNNSGLEFIESSPKEQYFNILKDYYENKIETYKFRADDLSFELELFTKVVLKYKSDKAKELLKKIIEKSNYYSEGNYLAPNEQLFLILENEDNSNYFSETKTNLSKKINKTKLESIRKRNYK